MPIIRNISPIGDLDVPLLRRVVRAGEAVEVTGPQAKQLLDQPGNWQSVKGSTGTNSPEGNTNDDAA